MASTSVRIKLNGLFSVQVCEEETSASTVPDNIPGAQLDINILETYKVPELKSWLSIRGLHVSGNKAELIQRYIVVFTWNTCICQVCPMLFRISFFFFRIRNNKDRAFEIDPAFKKGKAYASKKKKKKKNVEVVHIYALWPQDECPM